MARRGDAGVGGRVVWLGVGEEVWWRDGRWEGAIIMEREDSHESRRLVKRRRLISIGYLVQQTGQWTAIYAQSTVKQTNTKRKARKGKTRLWPASNKKNSK